MRFLFLAVVFSAACTAASESAGGPPAPQQQVLVLYSKAECGPCKILKATLAEMNLKYVDGAGAANAGIEFYPTLVVLVDGKEIFRIVGNRSKDELVRMLR